MPRLKVGVAVGAAVVFLCMHTTVAGDWPMWRYDAARGGSSPDALPQKMQLQWFRDLPKARPAWPPTQPRLQFDAAPQPVVLGKRVFVPSTVTDSLTAYATEDGAQLWRFFAQGPIRFAPVAAQIAGKSRVYFVCDDGYLYCLNAVDGKLIWKVRGGPTERWIIGNHRLISSWPARGGPVLADGKIYFAASIWSFMGIFIHCIAADSGKTIWLNSGDGANYTVQPHGAPSFASVVPQGHLVVSGDSLIVPGGRSVPAVYDRHTGRLKYFQFDKRYGGHEIMAGRGVYFVTNRPYSLATGKPISTVAAKLIGQRQWIVVSGSQVQIHQAIIGVGKIGAAEIDQIDFQATGIDIV